MRTYLDCVACLARQAREASLHAGHDEQVHEEILRQALRALSDMDFGDPPPMMGRTIHRIVRELSGSEDPYRGAKQSFNAQAMELFPELQRMIRESSAPLETAVNLAVAGNMLDFAVNSHLSPGDIRQTVETAASQAVSPEVFKDFIRAVQAADDILYLGDNAGEIVFDRLLIEQLPREKITFVVRGAPVINDVTVEDAQSVGLAELVEVIDNGTDIPGTMLSESPEWFRQRFDAADLVISKGQGNYETLSDAQKNIFFIFKVKCSTVAGHMNCPIGHSILARSSNQ